MKENKIIVGIDWLQYKGIFRYKTELDKNGILQSGSFIFKKSEQRTKDFESLYNVQYCEETTGEIIDFAVVCADWNFKQRLGKDLQVVKVYNHNFYMYSIKEIVNSVKQFFYIEKIMRVDFYADFCRFDTCECETFIKRVANADIEINGGRQTQIILKHKRYESATFGTRNTPVRCYLYNKTKELKTSGKEYIYSFHELNGFEPDKQDVWRLEFSVLQPAMIMLHEDAAELYTIAELELQNYGTNNLLYILKMFVERYFQFKTNDTRRKVKKVKLFDSDFTALPVKLKNRKYLNRITKRTDKTVLKTIAKLNDELREFRMQELTHEQINYFVETRQLRRFYNENKEILNI